MVTDLDAPEQIDRFVDSFYGRVLRDPLLSPLFLEVARIDLLEHLPRIKAYWRKMLLGDSAYRRHMMQQHRELDQKSALEAVHYQRWLELFESTLAEQHAGPVTERARSLARRIAVNMRQNLEAGKSQMSKVS